VARGRVFDTAKECATRNRRRFRKRSQGDIAPPVPSARKNEARRSRVAPNIRALILRHLGIRPTHNGTRSFHAGSDTSTAGETWKLREREPSVRHHSRQHRVPTTFGYGRLSSLESKARGVREAEKWVEHCAAMDDTAAAERCRPCTLLRRVVQLLYVG